MDKDKLKKAKGYIKALMSDDDCSLCGLESATENEKFILDILVKHENGEYVSVGEAKKIVNEIFDKQIDKLRKRL